MKNKILLSFILGFCCCTLLAQDAPIWDHKQPCLYQIQISDVYDGDTVTANIKIGFGLIMHGQKLRLYGINTPEVRGPEKPDGIITRDRLRALISDKVLIMDSHGDDKGKYGRWLATLWLPKDDGTWININEWLVKEGLGKPASY